MKKGKKLNVGEEQFLAITLLCFILGIALIAIITSNVC